MLYPVTLLITVSVQGNTAHNHFISCVQFFYSSSCGRYEDIKKNFSPYIWVNIVFIPYYSVVLSWSICTVRIVVSN